MRNEIVASLARRDVTFSAISLREIAILLRKRRLVLDTPIELARRELLATGLREVPMDGAIGAAAVALEGLHEDLAHRIIAATALQLDAQLATSNSALLSWFAHPDRRAALDTGR